MVELNSAVKTERTFYEVEKILDKQIREGKVFYRVKWKNYSEACNTWEPTKNLRSCIDLVDEYNEVAEKTKIESDERKPKKKCTELQLAKPISSIIKSIVGGKKINNCVMFTVEFMSAEKADISLDIMRKKYPDELIDYLIANTKLQFMH